MTGKRGLLEPVERVPFDLRLRGDQSFWFNARPADDPITLRCLLGAWTLDRIALPNFGAAHPSRIVTNDPFGNAARFRIPLTLYRHMEHYFECVGNSPWTE